MLLLKGEKSNCCKADIAYKGYNTFTFETTSFCSKCMKECTTYFEKDEADEAREKEVWIKIPDWIYYTGKVTVEYQRPDGELYRSEFHPGDYEDALSHSLAEARREERTKIYQDLLNKQEFVTYKKDNGHGSAVPMSWVLDLLTGDNPEEEK